MVSAVGDSYYQNHRG